MYEYNLKKAQKLAVAVQKKLQGMEYNTVTFKKVTNLSRSDMEILQDLVDAIIDGEDIFDRRLIDDKLEQILLNTGVIK